MNTPSKRIRKLAAIMFTDIVGYTSMMQEDEEQGAKVRALHRKIFESEHRQFHGEIIQYYGDGTLSIFDSAVDAVLCAVAMQRSFRTSDPLVPVRIGVHMGDIVHGETEIYGDGVNTTSRIESLAIPGSILISDKLNNELRNHKDVTTISLGFFELKNVIDPVEIFSVSNGGIQLASRSDLSPQSHASKSVAVLPLNNLSGDPNKEYLCDGFTEEIINALVKIKGLKVTSRTSSFYFKERVASTQEIANALQVSTLLQGSIQTTDTRIRISLQLIDTKGDYIFWSETFDRTQEDLFALQDEISLLVAERLREQLGHLVIGERLVPNPNISTNAYKSYLESRYLMLQMDELAIERAMDLLQDTLRSHPTYALAHLGMHLAYTLLAALGFRPAAEAFQRGRPHLDEAVKLNPDLPECQVNLSYIAFLERWDIRSAYAHLRRAFELGPSVSYFQSMASLLLAEGKVQAANEYLISAFQLDPFSEINYHLRGYTAYLQGSYDKALADFRQSLVLRPDSQVGLEYIGQALILSGQYEEAQRFYIKLPEKHHLLKMSGMAMVKIAQGKPSDAKKHLEILENQLDAARAERAMLGLIYCKVMMGDFVDALDLIDQALSLRMPLLVYLKVEPMIKDLHANARFQAAMDKVIKTSDEPDQMHARYKRRLLEPEQTEKMSERLKQVMTKQKPFKDSSLTLRALATQIDASPNQLSQLLNEHFDQNFSEFVNSYRLAYFKKLLDDTSNHQFTLLSLAYDSGFNSKSVFNSFFKKSTGQTPKQYFQARWSKRS